jgi:RNA polymerase sigma factor (sigma-70 family)
VSLSFWPDAYQEHAPGLRNFLRRRLRSSELAEDLTQDTFVRAMGAGTEIRDPGRVRSYLYQTAYRLMLNLRRRPDLVRAEHELGGSVDLDSLAPATSGGSEDAVRARELCEAVETILSTMTPDQANAFTWAVLEHRSYDEIEAHTGWSRAKVKITVFRARRHMMVALRDRGLDPAEEERSG